MPGTIFADHLQHIPFASCSKEFSALSGGLFLFVYPGVSFVEVERQKTKKTPIYKLPKIWEDLAHRKVPLTTGIPRVVARGHAVENQKVIITRYWSCGGTPCPYKRYRTMSCNTHCCRVDCAWVWNSWIPCKGYCISWQIRAMRITRNPNLEAKRKIATQACKWHILVYSNISKIVLYNSVHTSLFYSLGHFLLVGGSVFVFP